MATLYSTALSILAPVVDNGVLPGDPRVASRLDEAQRRLIEQYNFVSHREESLEDPLTWAAGGTSPSSPTSSQLILDNIDATKLMILCAYREENNQLEMADALEKKAFSYIERNVINQVERARYTLFSSLALTSQNSFGGLVGRLGLEIFSSYKVPYTRMQSYVNQAYQEAVDHYNFVVRNEQYDLSTLPWVPLSSDSDTFPTLLTAEVIRGLTLALLVQNNDSETQYTSGKEIQTFKEDSLKLIERNITASVESSRKATYETKALGSQKTFGGIVGRIGLETMVQYKMPLARLQSFVNQAYQEAVDHYNFVTRREDRSLTPLTFTALSSDSDTFSPLSPDILKTLTIAKVIGDSGSDSAGLKKQGFDLIERDVTATVQTSRKNATGTEGRLHNELTDGLNIATARITQYLSQANLEISAHQEFVQRREDYHGTTPSPTYEQQKLLVQSYVAAMANYETGTEGKGGTVAAENLAASLKKQALDLVERDIVSAIEVSRINVSGTEGRLHNELVDGVKIPTSRLTAYLTQAGTDATAHWNFLARREDYSSGTLPSPFDYEILKKLVESYVATSRAQDELATALKKEAFDLIERDLQAGVEAVRRQATGQAGQLANELVDGVKIPTSRLTAYLTQAGTDATAHWNFLARREDYSSGTLPSPFDYEILKKLVESYVATSRAQDELATALKKEAFDLIERDLQTGVETSRRTQFATLAATDQNTFGGLVGRLGLETLAQYKMPLARLQSFVNQAYQQAIDQYNFIVRSEKTELYPLSYTPLVNDSDILPQALPTEIIRALTLALISGTPELKAEAQQLIERNIVAAVQRQRFETRKALAAGDPNTFGYHWARLGLDMPDGGLDLSDAQLQRAVNTAEEQLINAGKWVGTVDTYTLPIFKSGEVFLPREVETILFAQFGSNPQPVFDRFNEWMTTGSGLRTTDQPWRYGFVDRGEGIDPEDGILKRKYFVSYPDGQGASMSDRTGGDSYAPY